MKKAAVILLLVLYGFSSSGMSIQLNYCCGKLKSIELFSAEKHDCGMTHKMGSRPCCETKSVVSKSIPDQMVTHASVMALMSAPVVCERPLQDWYKAPVLMQPEITFTDTSPPPDHQYSYIAHRVFRI